MGPRCFYDENIFTQTPHDTRDLNCRLQNKQASNAADAPTLAACSGGLGQTDAQARAGRASGVYHGRDSTGSCLAAGSAQVHARTTGRTDKKMGGPGSAGFLRAGKL